MEYVFFGSVAWVYQTFGIVAAVAYFNLIFVAALRYFFRFQTL